MHDKSCVYTVILFLFLICLQFDFVVARSLN